MVLNKETDIYSYLRREKSELGILQTKISHISYDFFFLRIFLYLFFLFPNFVLINLEHCLLHTKNNLFYFSLLNTGHVL